LSHELKTPLTALREGAELLNDQVGGPLAPPQRQVVTIMRDNSVKLQRLIEDLLDYQRALHAAASLEPRTVALDAMVREVARSHELAMRAKAQALALDLDKVEVEADPEKLRSILDNLLGNAVKFTPGGGTIAVAAHLLGGEAGSQAVIDVVDSGPACRARSAKRSSTLLSAAGRRAAPHRGHRARASPSRREFVEAHGGRITVSQPERALQGAPRRARMSGSRCRAEGRG
jgi:two-component system sensor histidine kinase GlrK